MNPNIPTVIEYVVEVEHTNIFDSYRRIESVFYHKNMADAIAEAWAVQGYRVWVIKREVACIEREEISYPR